MFLVGWFCVIYVLCSIFVSGFMSGMMCYELLGLCFFLLVVSLIVFNLRLIWC